MSGILNIGVSLRGVVGESLKARTGNSLFFVSFNNHQSVIDNSFFCRRPKRMNADESTKAREKFMFRFSHPATLFFPPIGNHASAMFSFHPSINKYQLVGLADYCQLFIQLIGSFRHRPVDAEYRWRKRGRTTGDVFGVASFWNRRQPV